MKAKPKTLANFSKKERSKFQKEALKEVRKRLILRENIRDENMAPKHP